jgi:hypothetical protein
MPPSLGAGPRPLEQRHRSIRRGGSEVALKQVARDRKFVTAVGRAHPSWPCHDGEYRARPPAPQYGIAKAKYLGLQPDRADARSHQVDRLPPALPGAVQIADGLAAKVMRRADLNPAADLSSSAWLPFLCALFLQRTRTEMPRFMSHS